MSRKTNRRRQNRQQAPPQHRPDTREVAVAQVTDKYSDYPSNGLTPVKLAEIFKEADAGDILRQAELFEEMEEKDPHLFSQLQTRKNAVTGLDFEIIPFDSDDERDKEIAEFVEAQINGIEGLEDIMLDLLDAIGKGFAVSEIMWAYEGGRVVVSDILICSPYGRQGNKERQEGNGETCRSRGSRTTAADKRMSSEADAHTGSSATRWSTSINNREMDQPLQSRGGSRASR